MPTPGANGQLGCALGVTGRQWRIHFISVTMLKTRVTGRQLEDNHGLSVIISYNRIINSAVEMRSPPTDQAFPDFHLATGTLTVQDCKRG